jgi:hypothetical protein
MTRDATGDIVNPVERAFLMRIQYENTCLDYIVRGCEQFPDDCPCRREMREAVEACS